MRLFLEKVRLVKFDLIKNIWKVSIFLYDDQSLVGYCIYEYKKKF